jgi:amphi-Trp domain-containing protein
MELIEITEKHNLSREEAARILRDVADSLERHNGLDFTRNGIKLHVDVADQVELEVELEIESDESSLEIEINW